MIDPHLPSARLPGDVPVYVDERQRVLRNTYWLLALSMVPTTIGAWIGVATGFRFLPGSPMLGFLLFLGVVFGLTFAIQKFRNSGVGVALLLAFTFFMGLWLSQILQFYLAMRGGPQIVLLAAGGTGLTFFGLATYAQTTKRDFSSIGKFLFIGVMMLIVASLANIWLQLPALQLTIAVIALGIFSAFLVHDVQRVVNGGETNYVTATLQIYVDLLNIFVSLLQILGFASRDD